MKILDWVYSILKRKTNAYSFIPQIDGLRALAILLVLMEHVHGFVITKVPFAFEGRPAVDTWWFFNLFDKNGRKGVLLFFMISGFILALPFAKHFWYEAKKVSLKRYFLRRLTRLEPPYIITMVFSFLVILYYSGHEFTTMFPGTFLGLFPNLASSLVYMHNILFPNVFSVNPVAWSLEIEIQFYLLVPLIVLILKLSKWYRRVGLVLIILLITLIQQQFPFKILTIYSFIQYFLMGFLLVDLYLSGWKLKINPILGFLAGSLIIISIFYLDIYRSPYYEYIFMAISFGFYVLVFTTDVWRKIFSFPILTSIGGMVYSIYLWHNLVVSAVGNTTIFFNVTNSYILTVLWHFAILFPIIIFFSTIFYLLVERPCMDKDWPRKLWHFISSRFRGKKAIVEDQLSNIERL